MRKVAQICNVLGSLLIPSKGNQKYGYSHWFNITIISFSILFICFNKHITFKFTMVRLLIYILIKDLDMVLDMMSTKIPVWYKLILKSVKLCPHWNEQNRRAEKAGLIVCGKFFRIEVISFKNLALVTQFWNLFLI